jgi:hypothetical protein
MPLVSANELANFTIEQWTPELASQLRPARLGGSGALRRLLQGGSEKACQPLAGAIELGLAANRGEAGAWRHNLAGTQERWIQVDTYGVYLVP